MHASRNRRPRGNTYETIPTPSHPNPHPFPPLLPPSACHPVLPAAHVTDMLWTELEPVEDWRRTVAARQTKGDTSTLDDVLYFSPRNDLPGAHLQPPPLPTPKTTSHTAIPAATTLITDFSCPLRTKMIAPTSSGIITSQQVI